MNENIEEIAVKDIKVDLRVVLGCATLRVHQMLKLGRGAVVELDRLIDEPIEVFADNTLIAKGEVMVTSNDMIGVNLTEIVKTKHTLAPSVLKLGRKNK